MTKPDKRAKEILDGICYLTIATVGEDGLPWNTPVYGAYDEDYNFYWGSHVDSQHSRNIRANGEAFIVVYDSTAAPGTGEGVYVQAKCVELQDSIEVAGAHKIIQDRRPTPYWKLEEVQGDVPVHLFKAIPQRIWRNDGGEKNGQYIDIRTQAEA